jgi:hypothetical protein
MGMKPLRYTRFQDFLILFFSVAGFLCAFFVRVHFGFSLPLLSWSFVVACLAAFGVYRARRAPFFYRALTCFIGHFSAFTVVFLLFSLAPR